jgi:hypothetical protein
MSTTNRRLYQSGLVMPVCRASLSVAARFIFGAGAILAATLASAEPMLYTGTVVTDVKVGGKFFHNAWVSIKFKGDTNSITPVPVPSVRCTDASYFYYLTSGRAVVSVRSQGTTLNANVDPGQIFVALDSCNGGIGFGSFTGPNGLEVAYPLAFTMGTAMVVANESGLWTPQNMSGVAFSCIGYPPEPEGDLLGTHDGQCIPPDRTGLVPEGPIPGPYPLRSDRGEIFVYMPYHRADDVSPHFGSLNFGTFAITPVLDD